MGIFDKKKEESLGNESFEPVFKGTYIEKDIKFVGDFVTEEPIELLGTVEGSIKSTENVHIAASGSQKGSMQVQNLYCDGSVDSNVICKNTASFSTGSVFTGEVTTVNIEASRGSQFKGKLNLVQPEDVKAE